jgi:hypothetical protein
VAIVNASGRGSYLDLPTASPFAIADLMPGARNLMDYVQLTAGEDVLVLAEHGVDPLVIQALSAAASVRDARVHVLSVPPFGPGGSDPVDPSGIVTAAVAQADVILGCTWWAEVHTAPLFFTEIPRLRARWASLHMAATASTLTTGGRYPLDILYAILAAVLERCDGARLIRVRTALGTDVTFGALRLDRDAGPLGPGSWKPFPVGGVNFYPDDTNGVLVVEESTVTGVPGEPVRIELQDNVVTAIHGGSAAAMLRRFSPNGYYLRHAFIGVNPRVRIQGGTQFEREKHAGAFYLGIDGLTQDARQDRSGPGRAHCDCQFDRPTIDVDGVPLVVDGHLLALEDAGVRTVASRYGDPDHVLDDNPLIPLYLGSTKDVAGVPREQV